MKIFAGLAALVLFAVPAAAQTVPSATASPSRAVAGTHTCAGYYPDAARRDNEAGTVYVSYDVEADGTLTHVHVYKSSGFAALDLAATRCVSESWRNVAATEDGVPVASRNHRAAIAFRLVDGAAAPAFRIAGMIYALIGLLLIAIVAASIFLFRRRPGGVRGPVVCGKCGTLNIVPDTARAPRKCGSCGQPFNV
jgi:TonB family protein